MHRTVKTSVEKEPGEASRRRHRPPGKVVNGKSQGRRGRRPFTSGKVEGGPKESQSGHGTKRIKKKAKAGESWSERKEKGRRGKGG